MFSGSMVAIVTPFDNEGKFAEETYRQLIEALSKRFSVVSSEARPLWSDEPPASLKSWSELAADLEKELASHGLSGVVGVGHSLGAVMSLLAAVKNPSLFRAVIAIDPLVMTGSMSVLWGLMKAFGLAQLKVFGEPVTSSLKRNSVTPWSRMMLMCTVIRSTIVTGKMAACST